MVMVSFILARVKLDWMSWVTLQSRPQLGFLSSNQSKVDFFECLKLNEISYSEPKMSGL